VSTGADVWKQVFSRVARPKAEPVSVSEISSGQSLVDRSPEAFLVQHLFFGPDPLRRVLFVAVNESTRLSQLCVRVGMQLATTSLTSVALIDSRFPQSDSIRSSTVAISPSSPFGPNGRGDDLFSHLPPSVLTHAAPGSASVCQDALPFSYVLFASQIADVEMPTFSRLCEAAVLVLTANETRREAAIRAHRTLRAYGIRMLGAMLDGRDFPIPQSIYDRL
jgi:hypothetical protein